MKVILVLLLSMSTIFGCANKHPYNYSIDSNAGNLNKTMSVWIIENTNNRTNLQMTSKKQSDLTNEIFTYFINKGLKAQLIDSNEPVIESNIGKNSFIVKTNIIESMAEISNNAAGWNGTSEDPLDFWSHFTRGGSMQFLKGSIPALSLFVEVYSGDKKYYESAGGIELVGKYNKYSGHIRTKDEIVSDKKRFRQAIAIAFNPLMEILK